MTILFKERLSRFDPATSMHLPPVEDAEQGRLQLTGVSLLELPFLTRKKHLGALDQDHIASCNCFKSSGSHLWQRSLPHWYDSHLSLFCLKEIQQQGGDGLTMLVFALDPTFQPQLRTVK